MKILIVHNQYQHRGGEDVVREAESRLLRNAGHTVIEYVRSNSECEGSALHHLSVAAGTIWSSTSRRELRELLLREKPDVAHFHNTFPLISPSAYYACAAAGVPVIQTLHNFRLLCPGANFLRDGRVCEECLGCTLAWPALAHACYRQSRPATAAAAAMLAAHRAMNTWRTKIALYLALTEFSRQKFIVGGLPAERIAVKPNFVEHDPGPKRGFGHYALYVGRLSEEKGLRTLLSAWLQLSEKVPLKIAGHGPLQEQLLREFPEFQGAGSPQVEWLGPVPRTQIPRLMHGARFLIFPSICFENFPLAIAEAFACGLPVIGSRLGATAELVSDSSTGLLFTAGDARDLAAKVAWAWTHPDELFAFGRRARAEYQAKYTASVALRHLESLYERALRTRPIPASTTASPTNRVAPAVSAPSSSFRVLGVRIDAVQIPDVIGHIETRIRLRGPCRYIAVTDMHSLMQAQHSPAFKEVLRQADLAVPNGFPLVWLGRRKGFALPRRVYGPELMESFCAATAATGYRHFFYGGAPGVAERLAARFALLFPGLQIAGTHGPPFRPPTPEEDAASVALINASRADVVWVGLGAPKQERWMFDHRNRLNAPILIGVGAAFDFHTGRVAQAPLWMRDHGFEWLFRLSCEPARLWRRYLIHGSHFVALVLLEALGIRKFP